MHAERPPEPWTYDVHTIIFDLSRQEPIAFLNAAVWPPVGSVIELVNPDRDAVVIGVRLMLSPPGTGTRAAAIVIDVEDPGERGSFVPRDVAERLREG
jgi:hypothetical protein